MAILIDADVIIQAERGLFDLDRWLESLPQEEFKLAAITVAELWQGAEQAAGVHRAKRRLFLQRIFSIFDSVTYDASTAFTHARLWAELESRSQVTGSHDMILAATALHSGNAVATFNPRHFASVRGLKVIQPK
jgi:tRNA(fMet)-specific endonuclease VapC